MSVIDYLYLATPESCNIDEFIAAARSNIAEIEITQYQKARSKPNWKWLSLVAGVTAHYEYLFCVERNSAAAIRQIRSAHPKSKHIKRIADAKKVVWTQIRSLKEKRGHVKKQAWKRHEEELMVACKVHNQLVLTLARLGHAIIDRPEHNSLYTSRTFRGLLTGCKT